jgi:hypothetical protein
MEFSEVNPIPGKVMVKGDDFKEEENFGLSGQMIWWGLSSRRMAYSRDHFSIYRAFGLITSFQSTMTRTFGYLLVLLLHMIGGVPIDVDQPKFVVGPFLR